jgi:hypothetical protein
MNQRIVLGSIALLGWSLGIQTLAAAPGSARNRARLQQRLAGLWVPLVPNVLAPIEF